MLNLKQKNVLLSSQKLAVVLQDGKKSLIDWLLL